MALYVDKSSPAENHTFRVTRPAWTGNTTLPSEVIVAPLKSNSKRLRFYKAMVNSSFACKLTFVRGQLSYSG